MVYSIVFSLACLCLTTCYAHQIVGPQDCTDREYFDQSSMGCYLSCAMPERPKMWSCATKPHPDCPCKKEYLRADNGECVLPSHCPPRKCPPNQHFKLTIACERTCEHPVTTGVCSTNPIARCVCNEGTYRTNRLDCVPLSKCQEEKLPVHYFELGNKE